MTVPEDLAEQLRTIRGRLDQLDTERAALVRERDSLIVRARSAGGSLREVGELAGLTYEAVRLIGQQDT